jgi:uncharacterized C2H2 Zn-finger protein
LILETRKFLRIDDENGLPVFAQQMNQVGTFRPQNLLLLSQLVGDEDVLQKGYQFLLDQLASEFKTKRSPLCKKHSCARYDGVLSDDLMAHVSMKSEIFRLKTTLLTDAEMKQHARNSTVLYFETVNQLRLLSGKLKKKFNANRFRFECPRCVKRFELKKDQESHIIKVHGRKNLYWFLNRGW